MSFSSAKRSLFSRLNPFARRAQRTPSRRPAPTHCHFRPSLEALEDRTLLSPTLISDTTSFPARAVVDVISTFSNGQVEYGTGTMVNANTVLTAGHMVYDYSAGGFAKSIEVVAGRNGNNGPYGVAHMTYEQTFNSFIADNQRNPGHAPGDGDIGFISLDRDLGDLTGWLGFMAASGPNYNVNIDGYPDADGYDGSQMYHYFGPLNENAAGSVSGFGYWGWSTSSMSTVPGDSGSSLVLDINGQMGIIGVLDLGPLSGVGECYAEVTTQTVVNSLTAFESAHPSVGEAGYLAQVGTPPSLVVAGSLFNMNIAAEDGNGNILSTYNDTVYLSILSGPSGASLGGNSGVNAVNGVASFSNLYLNTPGTYTLLATSSHMKSVITETITVESYTPPPTYNPPTYNPPTYNPPINNTPSNNTPSNNTPTNNTPTNNTPTDNPTPQTPDPLQEAATDALSLAHGFETDNIGEIFSAWNGFVSLYFQTPAAQQLQLWDVFYNDVMDELF